MIDVIIPSFKDKRIIRSILSIKACEIADQFKIIIVDGGSGDEFLDEIRPYLREHDILHSERDEGIFDALNKGLDLATGEYIFWIGSDDFINPTFNFSNTLEILAQSDVAGVVGRTHYFNPTGLTRPLYYKTISLGTYKRGVHVPHFSSIWKNEAIGDLRFDLKYRIASDYDFFFLLLKQIGRNRVVTVEESLTYMQEGGNSSRSIPQRLKGTKELFRIHVSHTNFIMGMFFVVARYWLKITLKLRKRKFKDTFIVGDLSDILMKTK